MSKHKHSAFGRSVVDNKGRSCANCEGHFTTGIFHIKHWCGQSNDPEVQLYDYPHPSHICLDDDLYVPIKGAKATKYGDSIRIDQP